MNEITLGTYTDEYTGNGTFTRTLTRGNNMQKMTSNDGNGNNQAKHKIDIRPEGIFKNDVFFAPLEYGKEIRIPKEANNSEVNFHTEIVVEYMKNQLTDSGIEHVFKLQKKG